MTEKTPSAPGAHLMRWITAIVVIPVVFYAIALAPLWTFFLLLTACSLLAMDELNRLLNHEAAFFIRASSHGLTVLFLGAIFLRELMLLPFILFLWVLVPMTYLMFSGPEQGTSVTATIGRNLVGPIYILVPIAMLASIRMRPNGVLWIFFMLAVVVATDTGAFYFGRLMGRRKLYERVSPKKTWEGAVGGTFSAVAVAWIYVLIFPLLRPPWAVLLGLVLSVCGQVGDLAESLLKRCHAVKDSGHILPGHGGMLDRIDSIIFASPALYLSLIFL